MNHSFLKSRRSGAAVVELAVCLPVLMMIVVATIESSAMIFLQQSLSIAAYEGARVSLTPGASTEEVVEQCELILRARDIQGASVRVTPQQIESARSGDWIAIETIAPFGANSLLGGWLFINNQLTAHVEMMNEREREGASEPSPPPTPSPRPWPRRPRFPWGRR